MKSIAIFPTIFKDASFDKVIQDESRIFIVQQLLDALTNNKTNWFYLHGMFGTGKSYLASAMCNEILDKGGSALFAYMPQYIKSETRAYMKEVDCLVLDKPYSSV